MHKYLFTLVLLLIANIANAEQFINYRDTIINKNQIIIVEKQSNDIVFTLIPKKNSQFGETTTLRFYNTSPEKRDQEFAKLLTILNKEN